MLGTMPNGDIDLSGFPRPRFTRQRIRARVDALGGGDSEIAGLSVILMVILCSGIQCSPTQADAVSSILTSYTFRMTYST